MTSKLAYSTVQYNTVQYSTVPPRKAGGRRGACHQIRPGDKRWMGRREVGRLNPRREKKYKSKTGIGKEGKLKKSQRGGNFWRLTEGGEVEQRGAAYDSKMRNRARARGREIVVATHNVRTMAVDGTHGVGRALDVLSVYDRLGCDIIGLQETRRSGHSAFSQAGYLVYCSGECGGENGGKKGQGGVGPAVRPLSHVLHGHRSLSVIACLRLILNIGVEPRPLRLLWHMPRLKHRMLTINMHSGRVWTELWRRYLNMNSCSC